MNLTQIIVVVGIFALLLSLRLFSRLGRKAALEHLRHGAKVIDVRTEREFASGHLLNVVNIPLGDIQSEIQKAVPNKDQALLLHCLSGGRSGMAVRILRRLGYTKVFNLGSYKRAEQILQESLAEN
jgi:phage shock protein E